MLAARQIAGSDGGLKNALLAADLPVDDIAEGGRRFFRFDRDGQTVGYGGFEPHGQYALLRSMVVLPELRGRGLGRAVAEAVIEKARAAGCLEGFLLTTTAAEFFQHLGFAPIDRKYAPKAILATRQAATICATAALLARPLAT
jgi:N-acetylglutamate synthase-like GNAT family acetyltransferase